MTVVLVTVALPTGRLDLEVPADTSAGALVDALARRPEAVAAGYPAGDWSLRLPGGDLLPAGEPLTAGGVRDGAVLVLADTARPTSTPRSQRAPVIGVLSATAGMGRTTVAALLAGALAAGTGQLTVAVDVDPGPGSLSDRLAPGHDISATDLLALVDHPALTEGELLAFLVPCAPGLRLLATRLRRDRGPPLAGRDWSRMVGGLARHGITQVLDCPPGLADPGTRAVLASADQIVLVVEPTPAPASRRMARDLTERGLPVVAVPWDPHPGAQGRARGGRAQGGRARIRASGRARGRARGGSADLAPLEGDPPRRARRWDPLAHTWDPPAHTWDPPARAWDQVRRVAEVLVADWVGLGIAGPAGRGRRGDVSRSR
jgi:WXG100 protein secretion system (Wss), protein YukD